jgi:hypothetical protein
MYSFKKYLQKKEWYGGSANDPSSVEDEGDGGEGVGSRMEKPGAFPTYGDDLPITKKNKKNKQDITKKKSIYRRN